MKEDEPGIEDQGGRRRILYVDSGGDPDGMETIAAALRELGEVTVRCGLSEKTIEMVRETLKIRPFDSMVSHLPAARGARGGWGGMDRVLGKYSSYGPAFGLLHEVRKVSEMPIIVYTGAGRENIPAMAWDSSGVDDIIEKSNDPEADGQRLAKQIQYEWSRPADEPEAPRIERSVDGASLQMETVLRQRGGLGPVLCASIVKQFGHLSGHIESLRSDGSVGEASPLNDMMGIMTLCAPCGFRLRVRLDEATPEAEEALRAAHQLFNQKYL